MADKFHVVRQVNRALGQVQKRLQRQSRAGLKGLLLEEVCRRPYVDAERLGVHDYSPGGYMTAWIVGQTQRFQAAVVGAPCTDLLSS